MNSYITFAIRDPPFDSPVTFPSSGGIEIPFEVASRAPDTAINPLPQAYIRFTPPDPLPNF